MTLLRHPFTAVMAGPSQSGKSTLLLNMLRDQKRAFGTTFPQITVCFSRQQDLYKEMASVVETPIKFIHGLPEDLRPPTGSLLILDDLMNFSKATDRTIESFFIKNSHHYSVSVVYLIQNIFYQSPSSRTISLNTNFIILFSNPRDQRQMKVLASQFVPDNTAFFMSAYAQACAKPFGYIVLDFRQSTPRELRVRASVFPDADVFVDLKDSYLFDLSTLTRLA